MLAETMERSAAVRLARPKSRLKASPVMVVPMKLRTPGREGGKRVSGASAEGSASERRLAYEAQYPNKHEEKAMTILGHGS